MSFKNALAKRAEAIQASREVKAVKFYSTDCTISIEKNNYHFEAGELLIRTKNPALGEALTKIGALWQIGANDYFLENTEEKKQALKNLIGEYTIINNAELLNIENVEEDAFSKYKKQLKFLEEYLDQDLPAIQLKAIALLYETIISSNDIN